MRCGILSDEAIKRMHPEHLPPDFRTHHLRGWRRYSKAQTDGHQAIEDGAPAPENETEVPMTSSCILKLWHL